jgi:type IV secretion system protein VirB10
MFPQSTFSAQATTAGRRTLGRHPQAPPPFAAGGTVAQGPFSRFVLPVGTIIPIALESAVNADVGGTIVMRVTADVLGRNMEHILIPAGTEVVSDYGSPSLAGQKRIIVGASRMNLPDGRFVDFRSTRAADAAGRAGLSGEVDRHLLSRFGAVGALAVIGTAANLTRRPSSGLLFGGRERFRDEVLYSGADQVNRVLARALQSQINRRPTVRLEPGMLGRLILNEDLDMGAPYYEEGPDQTRLLKEYHAYQQRRAFRRAQALTRHRR